MYRVLRCDGDVAQLGEHLPGRQKVTGSTPVISTNVIMGFGRLGPSVGLSTVLASIARGSTS